MNPLKSFKLSGKQYLFQNLPMLFPTYTTPTNTAVNIVTLLCHKDVYMFLYAIHSFFYFTKQSFPVTIINDGTLTKGDIQLLRRHFFITLFTTNHIEKKLSNIFSKYLFIKHFITASYTPVIKWKLAFMLRKLYPRYIFLDGDILFFQEPTQITNWIKSTKKYCLNLEYDDRSQENKGNADDNYLDIYHAYRECLKSTYFPNTNTLFNNGILCVPDNNLIQEDKLNTILEVVFKTHFDNQFGTDELVLSCLFTNMHSRSLPKCDYSIQLNGPRPPQLPTVCKHYCWQAKQFFPLDAIRLAAHTRLFTR
jgi:hypothetical protein